MITLYHGSYIQVGKPLVKLGRKKVDFGQGFYLPNCANRLAHGQKLLLKEKDATPYRLYLYIHLIMTQ